MLISGLWGTIVAILVFVYGMSIGVRVGERDCTSSLGKDAPKPAQPSFSVKSAVPIAQPCEEDTSNGVQKVYTDAHAAQQRQQKRTCDSRPSQASIYLHKWKGDVAKSVFHNLHNPASAAASQFVVTDSPEWKQLPETQRPKTTKRDTVERTRAGFRVEEGAKEKGGGSGKVVSEDGEEKALDAWDGKDPGLDDFWDPYLSANCNKLYLTRTGSRGNQPNKCVAIARVDRGSESINQQSHRVGFTARLTDQYQADYSRRNTIEEEAVLLPPLVENFKMLKEQFRAKVGAPIDPVNNTTRTIIVMVANEGVYDLLLNFVCSAEAVGLDKRDIIVFTGTRAFAHVVENLGVHSLYSTALGSMPERAAGSYLDKTFSRMMWFKTTSVYLANACGFHVMFQDVDLVWLENPVPYLLSVDADVAFMDDGARSPRYTPFFVNSGFFLVKNNARTRYFEEKMAKCGASEIGFTHSHQSVLIRHVSECHHFADLSVFVLDRELFPSGQAYHENKPYIRRIQARSYKPFVFHMCWTSNRVDKLRYFKDIGLWYLPDEAEGAQTVCSSAKKALTWIETARSSKRDKSIPATCCQTGKYWT